jgi:maltooligosyltrehalose trehalohydrolase
MRSKAKGRHLPVGAEVGRGGVHFRVWAPRRRKLEIVLEDNPGNGRPVALEPEENGYFSITIDDAGPGTRYRYRLGSKRYADPASRFQPEGPEGPSEVVDPDSFKWTDHEWRGPALPGQVILEVHIGTFTPEGTWDAAIAELPALADIGITTIELMPVAEFPGRFGWGYDGVNLFAPYHGYGTPDDFRRFVNEAHGLGLAVILDVVYNHFGPEGNYLPEFSDSYLSKSIKTEWGPAINFDGADSGPVRDFFLANVAQWIAEYHLDGLRIDATQEFYDRSPEHILTAIVHRARESAGRRSTLIIGETEPQDSSLIRSTALEGKGLDAVWNEDFHHVAVAVATGHREVYYGDYHGSAQEFVSMVKRGFLYQGQRNLRQKKRRGSPTRALAPAQFIGYLDNHDQVANALRGERLHQRTSPNLYRALTALQLLSPGTPHLFMGQDFAASSPFLYFGDHEPDLAALMRQSRAEFLAQFPSLASPEAQALLPDPSDPETFRRSKLDLTERQRHPEAVALHRDLLHLRRADPTIRAQGRDGLDGAVLGPLAFVIRHFGLDDDDRLMLFNLGVQLQLAPISEPLLAPPPDRQWAVVWSSEDPKYGGSGTPPPITDDGWQVLGHAALVLGPSPIVEGRPDA